MEHSQKNYTDRLCGRRCLNLVQIRKGKKPRDAKDQNNIVRPAFCGGSFIGNLCLGYLTQKICNQLTKTAKDKVVAKTQQESLITKVI